MRVVELTPAIKKFFINVVGMLYTLVVFYMIIIFIEYLFSIRNRPQYYKVGEQIEDISLFRY